MFLAKFIFLVSIFWITRCSAVDTSMETTIENSSYTTTFKTASACSFPSFSSGSTGFFLKYYNYPWSNSDLYSDTSFMATQYTQYSLINTASGIAPTYISRTAGGSTDISNTYGFNYYASHFTFEYTGFYLRMCLLSFTIFKI